MSCSFFTSDHNEGVLTVIRVYSSPARHIHWRTQARGVTNQHGWALDSHLVERLWRAMKYGDICLNAYANIYSLTLGFTE